MQYATMVRINAIANAVLLLLSLSPKIANSASDRQQINHVIAVNASLHANLAK